MFLLLLPFIVLGFSGCGKPTPSVGTLAIDITSPARYADPQLPAYYSASVLAGVNTPRDNPVTDQGATLGRVIFYDPQIAVGNRLSCASCHQQAMGFGAPTQFSAGFQGEVGTFHSMRLGNIAFFQGTGMFWDQRAPTLEAQSTQPIQNAIEMGWDSAHGGMAALLRKMQRISYYPDLFTEVFGDASITEDRIQRVLSQFMRSMISSNSRWDQEYAKVYSPSLADRGLTRDLPGFSAQENRGKDLFMSSQLHSTPCMTCHQPPTFALSPTAHSNGLDAGETRIFKAPSLKGLSQGQPLMHDGRFTSLEQGVAHYVSGIQSGSALDSRLLARNGQSIYSDLTASDQAALVAFLKTLEDTSLKTDSRFSNPFQ